MYIIIDKKVPQQAKDKLADYGKLIELETSGITYEAISGHPDVFFHLMGDTLIYAPNLPEKYKKTVEENIPNAICGEQGVGMKYPASSAYNAVSTPELLIHNFRNTDAAITLKGEDLDLIHVDQGYTRCTLLPLDGDHFITSDEKTQRVLHRFEKDCLYVDPAGITLEGFEHGFFGGCCGILGHEVFILGSLDKYPDGKKAAEYLKAHSFTLIELFNGPLFDGGSILFIPENN